MTDDAPMPMGPQMRDVLERIGIQARRLREAMAKTEARPAAREPVIVKVSERLPANGAEVTVRMVSRGFVGWGLCGIRQTADGDTLAGRLSCKAGEWTHWIDEGPAK